MPLTPRRILTATQETFLEEFFRTESGFYLSGGTALSAYYLYHRLSDDLDFFTREVEDLRGAVQFIERAARAASLTVDRVAQRGELVQAFLSGDQEPDHPLVKVECVTDPPPHPAEPRVFSSVRVDDALCIAVNKTTIHTRFDPKDYVDLYLVVRDLGYPLEDLIPRAQEKMVGLDRVTLAARFDMIDELPDLGKFMGAYMLVDLDANEMVAFYKEWARRLYEETPPEHP